MAPPLVLLETGRIKAICVGRHLGSHPFDARDENCLNALSNLLGLESEIRRAEQIHGDAIDVDGTLSACDAFLVRPGEAALVRHADCFPVVVACPNTGLAIVAHCGWKGVALGLAAKAVRQLLSMGCQIGELSAAIGPGIGPRSFEVGPEVLSRFESRFRASTSWGTPSVDLPAVLEGQLTESGIPPNRIAIASFDTFADPEFHSHRRERELSGRNATLCIVRKNPNPHQETQP